MEEEPKLKKSKTLPKTPRKKEKKEATEPIGINLFAKVKALQTKQLPPESDPIN